MEKSLGRSITDLEFCTVITEEMLELEVANIGFDGSSVNIKFKQPKMATLDDLGYSFEIGV
jgi:hypothetical protein